MGTKFDRVKLNTGNICYNEATSKEERKENHGF